MFREVVLSEEADRILNHLCSVYVGYRVSAPREIAKELLIYTDGSVLRAGRLHPLKVKSLGAGVMHVWLEVPNDGA